MFRCGFSHLAWEVAERTIKKDLAVRVWGHLRGEPEILQRSMPQKVSNMNLHHACLPILATACHAIAVTGTQRPLSHTTIRPRAPADAFGQGQHQQGQGVVSFLAALGGATGIFLVQLLGFIVMRGRLHRI